MRVRLSVCVVAAAAIVAALLRLPHLGRASFWLDEIIDFDAATKIIHAPWWAWITGFGREHGPLFFATQVCGRIFATPEVAARIAPALLGVVTIPVVWLAARAARADAITAAAAALLLAISPLHVYYSREARPYGLLMLLATIALIALLRGNIALFAVTLVAAAYTTGVSGPLIVACGIAAGAAAVLTGDRALRLRYAIAAFSCIAATGLVTLLYREKPGDATAGFPHLDARFFNELVQSFALQVLPPFDTRRAAYAMLLLAIAGAIHLVRRDRVRGAIVIAFAFGPVAAGLSALAYLRHWYNVRYICCALPAYVLLAAAGIAAIASWARREAFAVAIAAAALLAFGSQMLPAAREESYRKFDWRSAASTIWHHAAPGDAVLTENGWTTVCLEFYLRQLPPRVEIANAAESMAIAGHWYRTHTPLWIVRAGYEPDSSVSAWSCGFPLLLADRREDFRVHYSPSLAHFLQNRALESELRTLSEQFDGDGCTILFGPDDGIFAISGWAGIEGAPGDYRRWALNHEAAILLPVHGASDRTIRFRALPAGNEQRVRLSLDGRDLGTLAMKPGWNDYEVAAPQSAWSGFRHTLAMHFDQAIVPGNNDPRALSAMFESISVAPINAAAPPPLPLHPIRLQEFDAQPESQPSRYTFAGTDRRTVTRMIARLGFATPGRATVERVTAAFLDQSVCTDDATFARQAYWALVGRDIGEPYARWLAGHWKDRRERARLIRGLIETPEFPVRRAK